MHKVDVAGINIHYLTVGRGPDVVTGASCQSAALVFGR